jgi:class 3 adenylate cyclase
MARPTGIVTFLITDIEGSTPRWESDPDGMRSALAVHDDVLRVAIEAEGGWLFKHTGDGVCAAFESPRAAVAAAIVAQRALALPVRMGIATGEAEQRGDDYFGPALNRAARVMAARSWLRPRRLRWWMTSIAWTSVPSDCAACRRRSRYFRRAGRA